MVEDNSSKDNFDANLSKSQGKNKMKLVTKSSKKIICKYCGALFRYNKLLENHINGVHLKIKPYACEVCNKSFTQPGHLKEHVDAIHAKIKPYKCEICEKDFSQMGNLKIH